MQNVILFTCKIVYPYLSLGSWSIFLSFLVSLSHTLWTCRLLHKLIFYFSYSSEHTATKYQWEMIRYFSLLHVRDAFSNSAPHSLLWDQGWKNRGYSSCGFLWQPQTPRTARTTAQTHLKLYVDSTHWLQLKARGEELTVLFPWMGWGLGATCICWKIISHTHRMVANCFNSQKSKEVKQ